MTYFSKAFNELETYHIKDSLRELVIYTNKCGDTHAVHKL